VAEWQTKRCKICGAEIKYNVNWSKIPDTCKPCIERERAKWKEARCKICGSTIKYNTDWGRVPDTCKPCIEKEKAKWKTKSCKSCGATIKYNVEWSKIPDLCKNCVEKEKAKWKIKRCEKCGSEIKYNTDWSSIPKLCKSCNQKRREGIERIKSEAEKSKWSLQSQNPDAIVKVTSEFSKSHPGVLRTDFLVIDRKMGGHKHFSIGEDTNWQLREWHDWK